MTATGEAAAAFAARFLDTLRAMHPEQMDTVAAQARHCRVREVIVSPGCAGAYVELECVEARRAGVPALPGRLLDGPMLDDRRAPGETIGSILWLKDGYMDCIEIWAVDRWSGDLATLEIGEAPMRR